MARKKDWEMSDEMADRIHKTCREGHGGGIPANLLLKAIQNTLKRNGGGAVMNQSFDEAQMDLNLNPKELAALMKGRAVVVTRSPAFSDRSDVVVQKTAILPKRNRKIRFPQ